ncbi:MAG: ATP-binding cassette domain-containing protein [Candidatus Eremiobacteraeota bacterium]|nr:ATP-binding cassette domain-containing protein [Candidatus Eremiobacteraeota bacterium]
MLVVDHVRKDFGAISAVRDVSFEIGPGSTFGLLGPNGAGKTTTMRMILAIFEPDAGTITWNGRRVDRQARRTFGYLPEERGLYGKMNVRDQIAFFARLHGLNGSDVTRRTNRWIEELGLAQYAKRPCSELSKGNQQKVQIACAAVHEPTLLVLDEPFSGLDPVNADALLASLEALKRSGTTLVLSSHQMWQLETLCDRFCIIASGENRASGSLIELRAAFPTQTIRVAPPSPSVRAILERIPGSAMISENGSLDFAVPRSTSFSQLLRSLVAADAITRFEAIEPSLHDIYIRTIEEPA